MKLALGLFFCLACPAQIGDDFGDRLIKFYRTQLALMYSYFDCPKGATNLNQCSNRPFLLDASAYLSGRKAAMRFYELEDKK